MRFLQTFKAPGSGSDKGTVVISVDFLISSHSSLLHVLVEREGNCGFHGQW